MVLFGKPIQARDHSVGYVYVQADEKLFNDLLLSFSIKRIFGICVAMTVLKVMQGIFPSVVGHYPFSIIV